MKDKIKVIIKKIIKPSFYILTLMFITVFIISITGYYNTVLSNNNVLTNDSLKTFESDVLNGKKIVASNYLKEKKKYDNLISRTSILIGNIIENIFDKIMHFILKEIESSIR